MKTYFILDTNAYRYITEDKYLGGIMGFANELRYREKQQDAESMMSILVSMELLRHFDDTDPHFFSCFKALCLQYYHTQKKAFNEPGNSISFIPPVNSLLTQHFFSSNSDYFKHYLRIIAIIEQACGDLEPEDYKKDMADIGLIGKQLLLEKNEIKTNFETFLKSINGNILDWELFTKNPAMKKQMRNDIRSGKMLDAMAKAQIIRAHAIMELPFPQPGLQTKAGEFRLYYEPFLKLNQLLVEKMLAGVTALQDANNPKCNTLHDGYLLAAACFVTHREKGNDMRVIVVTDDKAVRLACEGTYMQDRVWKLREYLSFIF